MQDLASIGLLIFLEGVLSIDNALALAVIARQLPRSQQRKALTYGLVGAILFRFIALGLAAYLMSWTWVKFVGGGYLLWLAASHWLKKADDDSKKLKVGTSFWKTVLVIEITDMAFALDSILAAVAVTPKLWVVVTGGIIGLIMMRFAATLFIRLLEAFPNFENTAFLLVALIGAKLVLDGLHLPGISFHSPSSWAFWVFWIGILACIGVGFWKRKGDTPRKDLEMLRKEELVSDQISTSMDRDS